MSALRVRWWEGVLLALPLLLSLLFFAAGEVAEGVVLLALVLLAATSRAEIRELNVAGGFARARGRLQLVKAAALLGIYCVLLVLFFVMHRDHWTNDTRGTTAIWASAGLAFFLLREMQRVGDDAVNWLLGGEMEVRVAKELDRLRDDGWLVTHDIKKELGGNVDHFASGPPGAFAIETKRGKARAGDRNQAIWNAVWAKEKFGQRWVTAVVCVGSDSPQQPERHGHAWVVGLDQLHAFLRHPPST